MPLLCYLAEHNTVMLVFIDSESGVSDLNLYCSR